MKKIILLVLILSLKLLADLGYVYIVYDSDTHKGKYELIDKLRPEPKILKSIQKLPLNGMYKIFNSQGNLEGIEGFKQGKREGEQIKYIHTYRTIKETSFYKNGKLEGEYTKYTFDGKLIEVGRYKNNLPIGIEKQYADDGHLMVTVEYVDGKKFLRTIYHINNSIKKKIFYKSNGQIEKQRWYKENGSSVEEYYDDMVKFDADKLSKILYEEYHNKSCVLENNTYSNVIVKYSIDEEITLPNVNFISEEETKEFDSYTKLIFSNEKLVETKIKERKSDEIFGINYYDENENVRKSYWHYSKSIYMYQRNGDGSQNITYCVDKNDSYTIYHSTRTYLELSDSDGLGYYPEYPNEFIAAYQYKGRLKDDKLEKQSKLTFDKLKAEAIEDGDFNSTMSYKDREGRVSKIIDFKTREIIKYIYLENEMVDRIICKYKKGECSIENFILPLK